jgi:hypothetical protein
LRKALRRLREEVAKQAQALSPPENMTTWIRSRLKTAPEMPWDQAVNILAAKRIQQAS